MARMEVVIKALTDACRTTQMAPKNNTTKKVDPKNPVTYDPNKDRGKGKVGETSKRLLMLNSKRNPNLLTNLKRKRKGNHASEQGDQTDSRGRATQKNTSDAKAKNPTFQEDTNYCDDSISQSVDVEELCPPLDD
uniref:Uncharacterized protein n=1 Tax=Cannabis sativa TaxID=3483 RepID=A0A803NJJ0_CANSA